MPGVRRALLLPLTPVLAACLLLAACGDDPGVPASAGASPRPSASAGVPARPAPSARPASPSARPSPSASAPVPAGSPAPPVAASPSPPALAVPAAQGDVDGDGEPDAVSYAAGEARVVLSGSGRTVRASTEADIEAQEPATAGVEDVDRDGRAEVFVQVGQGASTGFLLVLRYDGRTLAPLQVDGRPRLLGVGGSATHGDGFRCEDDGTLRVRAATSEDGEAFVVETVSYRVRGSALVETARGSATATGMDDPAVAAAYVVDCRSVGEGA